MTDDERCLGIDAYYWQTARHLRPCDLRKLRRAFRRGQVDVRCRLRRGHRNCHQNDRYKWGGGTDEWCWTCRAVMVEGDGQVAMDVTAARQAASGLSRRASYMCRRCLTRSPRMLTLRLGVAVRRDLRWNASQALYEKLKAYMVPVPIPGMPNVDSRVLMLPPEGLPKDTVH